MKSKKMVVIGGKAKAINLRLPVNLHQHIKQKADTEGKSINLVIIELLEKGLEVNGGVDK